jgi:hypothetical protein
MVSKAVDSPYLPFGAGRYRCVGEQYAYARLGAIVATMVRLLKWEQVDHAAPVPTTDYSVSYVPVFGFVVLMLIVYVLDANESDRNSVDKAVRLWGAEMRRRTVDAEERIRKLDAGRQRYM